MSKFLQVKLDELKWAEDNNKPVLASILRETIKAFQGQLTLF